jgi:hypothetical protein
MIDLSLENPQSDLTYIIRWTVPKVFKDTQASTILNKKIAKLIKEINNKDSTNTNGFYNDLLKKLQEMFDDKGLTIILFAYDNKDKLLKAVLYPDDTRKNDSFKGLFVGRAPAGTAFKTRTVIRWELDSDQEPIDNKGNPKTQAENILIGLNPIYVIALPIKIQDLFDRIYTKSDISPLGVISICAREGNNELAQKLKEFTTIGEDIKLFSNLNNKLQPYLDVIVKGSSDYEAGHIKLFKTFISLKKTQEMYDEYRINYNYVDLLNVLKKYFNKNYQSIIK